MKIKTFLVFFIFLWFYGCRGYYVLTTRDIREKVFTADLYNQIAGLKIINNTSMEIEYYTYDFSGTLVPVNYVRNPWKRSEIKIEYKVLVRNYWNSSHRIDIVAIPNGLDPRYGIPKGAIKKAWYFTESNWMKTNKEVWVIEENPDGSIFFRSYD